MTDLLREQLRAELERQQITQREVAENLDVTPQQVWDMLSGRSGQLPKRWRELLDLLGLELVIRAKEQAPEDSSSAHL